MSITLESPAGTRTRDTKELLNAVRPKVAHLLDNVTAGGSLWEREIALLLRDAVEVRSLAERILNQAVAYLITAMEQPGSDLGVGRTVDIGVHQIILDTPVYFAFCDTYNGGIYKHHAPLIRRRRDGTVLRTAGVMRDNGFEVDDELWVVDASNCSPCNDKVPDSH
ncbi:hypothetical protein [Streptomyces sp. NPDC058989]|uniref:hypothetical protein n=1 Tax=Streptomyces sp. NPDC058989 TaxID=3346686 RepID=UPI0036903EA3